jgi:hypothetical protein
VRDWLWRCARCSRDEIVTKSAVPSRLFDARFAALVGNRILYPDGTVNSFVERHLRDRVLELFQARPRSAGRSSAG